MNTFSEIEFILYVSDQEVSCNFYRKLLQDEPVLNVPGMTEFRLGDHCKLGLMPEKGIAKLLGKNIPHPESGHGIPRSEIYLTCDDADRAYLHALNCGAILLSKTELRDWGAKVCYFSDPDGHVIAFASKTAN